MDRNLFSTEHEIFRDSVAGFVRDELVPFHAQWEQEKLVPRAVWRKAGAAGMLCPDVPEEYGGYGADWLYNVIVIEELAKAGMTGPGFTVHTDMVAPYILAWASEEVKHKWLPRMVTGEAIGAVAMTEPGAGSDLKAMRTRAVQDGDHYVVNGQKTYISNGQNCDFILLTCKTDPAAGAKGISIILTEANREGFARGRNLEKIGMKAQDTSELFFADLRVPVANRLGNEGEGFKMLMTKLAQERLTQAVRSICVAEAAIGWTVTYTKERKAFGHTIADFQNTQFVLAQLAAETSALRVFTDWCIAKHLKGELSAVDAAKVKLTVTDLHNKVVNECLQFFGGYGYMHEYPIARAFIDARITRIAGGAAEVMKQIISRDLFARGSI
jgi:alkylation response protein AidB-like acyl-CoA dehydrogenase